MFYFFVLKILSIEHDECEGQNTIRDKDGNCHCLPDFPFGDPNSKDGCYKCLEQCHEKAICAPPGKCKCIQGLVGDGKTQCNFPTPQVIDVTPKQISKDSSELISVSFTTSSNYTALSGFCKIGNQIQKAISVTENNVMKCNPPKSTISAQRVSISFDNVTFSEEQFFIELSDAHYKPSIQIVWQVWAVVLMAVIAIVIYTNFQKSSKETDTFSPEERIGFKSQPRNPMTQLVSQEDD